MHPCLTIDEILLRIFSNLAPPWPKAPSDRNIRTLTSVALVCKTFYEPAMAVSWASLEGFDRLIPALPDEVVANFEEEYGYVRSSRLTRSATSVVSDSAAVRKGSGCIVACAHRDFR